MCLVRYQHIENLRTTAVDCWSVQSSALKHVRLMQKHRLQDVYAVVWKFHKICPKNCEKYMKKKTNISLFFWTRCRRLSVHVILIHNVPYNCVDRCAELTRLSCPTHFIHRGVNVHILHQWNKKTCHIASESVFLTRIFEIYKILFWNTLYSPQVAATEIKHIENIQHTSTKTNI